MSMDLFDIREFVQTLGENPLKAADELDALAGRLREHAKTIRENAGSDWKSPGGMRDRVKMCVVGPGGEIKQTIDTGA